jgi:hypothetical protein
MMSNKGETEPQLPRDNVTPLDYREQFQVSGCLVILHMLQQIDERNLARP